MSVDLSILVRNDFNEADDPQACRRYVMTTIERLKKYFLSEDIVEDLRLEEDEMCFYLKPLEGVLVHLHNGCWEFETFFHYISYFFQDENSSLFLRRFAFDCARAFGQSEAWVTDEHHGWFGLLDSVSDSFEKWLESPSNQVDWSDEVLEYDPEDFPGDNISYDDFSAKYHDSFDEPKQRLAELSAVFHDFELLTISGHTNIILGKRDGQLYALDLVRKKPLVDCPIDGINDNYNSVAIGIYKDGKSALFNSEGEQLTPFGDHEFCWEWKETKNLDRSIKITDNVTGNHWTFPL